MTLALLAFAIAAPGIAQAEFLPGARLMSWSPERQQQGQANTTAVDISGDGRYVAFQTISRNLFPLGYSDPPLQHRAGGIFRSNVDTGTLELVAFGNLNEEPSGRQLTLGAQNPSINGSGRYVAFSTRDPLVAADVNVANDVYVRDMEQPLSSPTAFELVSARDGGDQPATYGGAGLTGSQLPVESAISAAGRKVIFGTQAVSDLPAEPEVSVSSGQLYLRDLDAKTTTLVTRDKLTGTPVGGLSPTFPANISADGTTVAWVGKFAAAQTRLQPGEPYVDGGPPYYMWRRVADGPGASTRRITGASDVDDPACSESEVILQLPTATGPCYGPLSDIESFNVDLAEAPAISADGMRVAFITVPTLRPAPGSANQYDAFVTDMSSGVTRKAGTIELTREVVGTSADVRPVKISADGRRIVFVTTRQQFPLTAPRLVNPPSGNPWPELYLVELDRMEIRRIGLGRDGADANNGVDSSTGAVAMSADGRRVAFLSLASNLFPGDSNEARDAYVAFEDDGSGGAARLIEPPFADVTPREDAEQRSGPSLPVSLRRGGDGSLRVIVRAPQAGRLRLTARARVRSGRRARLRPVARASKRVRRAGRVTVVLRPERRYRRYVRREKRLRSRLEVRFSPTGGGRTLVARRTVSFTR